MKDIKFLEDITTMHGGSGDETLVRNLLKEEIEKVTPSEIDGFGNIIGRVGKGKKVIAVGHMDEIGYMVRDIAPNGMIKLSQAGFVFPQGAMCQIYTICTSKGQIEGVIGFSMDRRSNEFPSVDQLELDIGCKSKKEVEELGVEIGNAVIAKSRFLKLQNDELLSKAWDNRIGCAISVRVLQELSKMDLHCEFIGGGSVQEEVGCRGAKALAVNIKPSIAFSLDTSPASSQSGFECGKGPQLFVMDSSTIGNKKLLAFVKKIANEKNIPYQVGLLNRGGTDLSELQNAGGGCPSLAIGIAVRNIHSPVGIINYNDYENAVKLMVEVISSLDDETIEELSRF